MNPALIPDDAQKLILRFYMEGLHRRMHMRELKIVMQRVQKNMDYTGYTQATIVAIIGKKFTSCQNLENGECCGRIVIAPSDDQYTRCFRHSICCDGIEQVP